MYLSMFVSLYLCLDKLMLFCQYSGAQIVDNQNNLD